MAYINQKKNLKLVLIDSNGKVIVCYSNEIEDDRHSHALLHTIKTKLSKNKKLVKKAEKRRGQNAELISLMLDNDFVIMYDTTNYHNYRPKHSHTGTIMLPKAPEKLSRSQQISLLKLSKELPMEKNAIEHNSSKHSGCVPYSLLQAAYLDIKNKVIDLGNIEDLVTRLVVDKLEMPKDELQEVSIEVTPHYFK